MRKNICLIAGGIYGGGSESVTLSLAKTLSELNCNIHVILLNNRDVDYSEKNLKFKVHNIIQAKHPIIYIQDKQNAKYLSNKISKIGVNFDLIISNTFGVDRVCKKSNLSNVYYCIHSAMSMVIDLHSNKKKNIFKAISRARHLHLRKKIYKGERLISVSKGVEKDLIKLGIQPKTIQTIYNPFDFIDIEQQSRAYTVNEKDYIIHVGRFDTGKRHDVLINAYKKSRVKQKLLLLGDDHQGTGKQIKKLVSDLNLQNKVIFKGFCANPFPYIKNSKAMILCSDYEGLPTVLIEALILRVPIISTNCLAGPDEILIDELEQFLSPIGDPKALAKNIKKILENPVRITEKYIDRFEAKSSAKKYLALCK